ncbi:MAG TPA: (2Fe-2S)-binding protein [Polyangia bacterium]
MSQKIVLCRCEDVTYRDLDHAVATGFSALEEVKRYTGFGTGPCQGKECLRLVVDALAQITGQPAASLQPFTSRAPLAPTELALLAAGPEASEKPPR